MLKMRWRPSINKYLIVSTRGVPLENKCFPFSKVETNSHSWLQSEGTELMIHEHKRSEWGHVWSTALTRNSAAKFKQAISDKKFSRASSRVEAFFEHPTKRNVALFVVRLVANSCETHIVLFGKIVSNRRYTHIERISTTLPVGG